MKVLFYHLTPFAFAHGGLQTQIIQTREALLRVGVEVEFFRWYDGEQTGDVLHFFGRIPSYLPVLAHRKQIKVVLSDLLGGQSERSRTRLWLQRTMARSLKKILPPARFSKFDWDGFKAADACIALTPLEAHLMSYLLGASPQKVHVIPNGVEEAFLNSVPTTRGKWLVCTATITPRKRVIELAHAAIIANVPLWVLGKPYSESDGYYQEFLALVRAHPQTIRYDGEISNREELARAYRQARGFVLLSRWESLSLSALEAAGCECPLLLSDLPWARTAFKDDATYCSITSASRTAVCLKQFYDSASQLQIPAKPPTWLEVATQLKAVYERILKGH